MPAQTELAQIPASASAAVGLADVAACASAPMGEAGSAGTGSCAFHSIS